MRWLASSLGLGALVISCSKQSADFIKSTSPHPNILLIIADDMGVEALSMYGASSGAIKANTPNIDRLAAEGITFDNVWASPLSAPTRAAAITGRYGHKTGIVSLNPELSTSERTLHSALSDDYANALIGKWHLTRDGINPETYGIDYFAGLTSTSGMIGDYYDWMLTEGEIKGECNEYAVTKITDLAIEWIESQEQPWFCWLAPLSPHTPFHLPPSYMHSQGELPSDVESVESNPLPYYLAMVESLDYEIGRLMEAADENTIVIFMGDNGTNRKVVQAPFRTSEGKGTIYEGGIRVPLIVSGAEVTGGGSRSDILISAPDIFATVMELSGEQMSRYEDSYSLAQTITNGGISQRKYSFSEVSSNGNPYTNAIRNAEYKLITELMQPIGFYKIDGLTEGENLLGSTLSEEAQKAYDDLTSELERMNINYLN